MSVQYKKILIAIDGSKNSIKALSHAVAMARSFDAELCILYISAFSQQLPLTDQIKGSKIPQFSPSNPESFAKKVIAEALRCVPEGIRVTTHDEPGEPRIAITEFAERNGYDVIVLGSRGLGTISGLLMGSVSSYVIHKVKCPVFIIK